MWKCHDLFVCVTVYYSLSTVCGQLKTERMCGHSSCSGYKHWPLTTLYIHWTDETVMDGWLLAVSRIYVMDLFVSTLEQQKSQRSTRGKSHPIRWLWYCLGPRGPMVPVNVGCHSVRVRGSEERISSSSPLWMIGDLMQRLPACVKILCIRFLIRCFSVFGWHLPV